MMDFNVKKMFPVPDVSSLSSPTSTTSPTTTVAVIPPESITPPVTDAGKPTELIAKERFFSSK